jgi:hypothetical protein
MSIVLSKLKLMKQQQIGVIINDAQLPPLSDTRALPELAKQ